MLRWLLRLLRPGRRPAAAAAQRALPSAATRPGRRRISTTAEEFDAHLARRRP